MIRYELRRNGILFHATTSAREAFRLFTKWTRLGTATTMTFVTVNEK